MFDSTGAPVKTIFKTPASLYLFSVDTGSSCGYSNADKTLSMKSSLSCLFFLILVSFTVAAQSKEDNYKKALDYFDQEKYANSLREVAIALRGDSTNLDYLVLKARIQVKLKLIKPAFETYAVCVALHPESSLPLNDRGILLNSLLETDLAIQDFTRALNMEINDTLRMSLYLNRGTAKINKRDFQGAYEDFMASYKYDSLSVGILNNLATVCDEIGKGEKTLEFLFKIISIDSTFIGAYVNIGYKYSNDGKYQAALPYFDKAIALDPNEPLAYNNRAYCKFKLGDLKGALSDVNQSIVMYPSNSYAFRNRALILLAQKKMKAACEDIQEALRLGFTSVYGDEVEKLQQQYCNYKSL